jgi:hypothetical protein
LARLRNQRFFSLAELNAAIRSLINELNARLMRKLGASRREFFENIDQPALMALPTEPYQYEWRRARVAPDYHVEVQRHFYSVPSRLIRQVVEVRITQTTVEVFHRGVRVASHQRSAVPRRHELSIRRLDPQERAGQGLPARGRRGDGSHSARQHPRR